LRYYRVTIVCASNDKELCSQDTQQVYGRKVPKGFSAELAKRARDKLILTDQAEDLEELRVPPGNKLEKLKGDRKGWRSIRINARYRVCFRWEVRDAYAVEIVDYHG
jgi:proteic killer suppression protein